MSNLKKTDFYFDLPKELIAQTPLKDRSSSKMLVLNKETGEITHTNFKEIVNYINKGDCIVLNDTKVIPARLVGRILKKNSDGTNSDTLGTYGEILLLKKLTANTYEAIVKPGRKLKLDSEIVFSTEFIQGNSDESSSFCNNYKEISDKILLKGKIINVLDNGNRHIKFYFDGIFEEILDKLGEMPLPHYITEKLEEKSRYQTVYAENSGSAAAPTAGLHFTDEILEALRKKGVYIAKITLHVGLGTFRPVKADNILEHKMHEEFYSIEKSQSDIINKAKMDGGRIIAVGTTSCRTLESCSVKNITNNYDNSTKNTNFDSINSTENITNNYDYIVENGQGSTDIFIYPPYEFKSVNALLTNFHLPESTLIMLVSALSTRENVLTAYEQAVKNYYRFFSFGDSMLII